MRKVLLAPSSGIEDGQLAYDTRCRCDRIVELWQSKKYDFVIVSGGIIVCEGQTMPAAILMKAYLVDKGIPEEVILVETGAVDSAQNIEFSIALLRRTFGTERFRLVVVSWIQHGIRLWLNALLGFRTLVWIQPAWYRVGLRYCLAEIIMLGYTVYDPTGTKPYAQSLRAKRHNP